MADEITELERCFIRYNAARAALQKATADRKQVFTHHSPAWYATVEVEARCFNETYEAHEDLKQRLTTAEAESDAAAVHGTAWSVRLPVLAGASAQGQAISS